MDYLLNQHSHCRKISSNKLIDAMKTPALVQPEFITLAQAKAWLKMENINDDDDIIEDLLNGVIDFAEQTCGISIRSYSISAIYEIHNGIELSYGPVTAVTSIVNASGTTLDASRYLLGAPVGFPRLRGYGVFTVEYTTGYTTLPPGLQLALKSFLAFSYEHRGDNMDRNDAEFAPVAKKMLFPFKRNVGV